MNQAAKLNLPIAIFNLERMHYCQGMGTAANLIHAMKLFCKSWSLSYERAKRWLDSLLEYNPDNPSIQYHAGMALNADALFERLKKYPAKAI